MDDRKMFKVLFLLLMFIIPWISGQICDSVTCIDRPGYYSFVQCADENTNRGQGGGGEGIHMNTQSQTLRISKGGEGKTDHALPYEEIDCCEDVTFNGEAGTGRYKYEKCPIELEVFDIDIPPDTSLMIKNVKCHPMGNCKFVLIDNKAKTPFSLTLSGPKFSITSEGKPGGISFRVKNGCQCPTGVCPEGWYHLNSHCYKLITEARKFNEQEEACQSMGADLACIHDKETLYHIAGHSAGASVWVGLRSYDGENTWNWKDGSHFSESYLWEEPEFPKVGIGFSCARVTESGTALRNSGCGGHFQAVCSKPLAA